MCNIFYKTHGITGILVKIPVEYSNEDKNFQILEFAGVPEHSNNCNCGEHIYDFEKEENNPACIQALKDETIKLLNSQKVEESVNVVVIVEWNRRFHFIGIEKFELLLPKKYNSKNSYKIIGPDVVDYAQLMFDIVDTVDQENWDYFSESNSVLATELINFGEFSRAVVIEEGGVKKAVGYIQLRILKKQAPLLLYKDLYHLAGLNGSDLWEKDKCSNLDLPIYIDVIAIKKEYQNKRHLLKLIPIALYDIISEIDYSIPGSPSADIYAVGVTNKGRKMCLLLGMEQLSEVERNESGIIHTRTFYKSQRKEFCKNLEELVTKHR